MGEPFRGRDLTELVGWRRFESAVSEVEKGDMFVLIFGALLSTYHTPTF